MPPTSDSCGRTFSFCNPDDDNGRASEIGARPCRFVARGSGDAVAQRDPAIAGFFAAPAAIFRLA